MLDIRLIRDEPDVVQASLTRRGSGLDLDAVRTLDDRARTAKTEVDELRAERNEASKQIGEAKRRGEDAAAAMESVRLLGDRLTAAETTLTAAQEELQRVLITIPNLVQDDVPMGGEDDATVERIVGEATDRPFEVRDHLDLGSALGMIDMERGARTSGSRFAYLTGPAVLVQYALVQYALDHLVRAGFTPVVPPVLVREEAMWGTGFFPADKNEIYSIPEENHDLFLVGTSEVPLAAMHADEILDATDLPLRYAGVSTCFRREAGAAGKDTRGIFRVHQFDKIEMFSFTEPDASIAEHEMLLAQEEALISGLDLPYRVVNVAAGDLGSSASKKYDIEVWLPGQARYRELTSCSNCTDYQARRLKARVRRAKGTQFVHTLNGTAIAIGRMLIALMENHQREDGTIAIPDALVKHGAPAVID